MGSVAIVDEEIIAELESDEELFANIVYSKIQSGEYFVVRGLVVDRNTNQQVCA